LIEDYLGEGGFGEVFKVTKQSTKETLALKSIKLGRKGTETYKKNKKAMEAEIEIGIKLGRSSPFLVELKEILIEKEYCFLIMEYCNGGDLEQLLNKINKIPQPVYLFIYLSILILLIFIYL
jgi:serine/threonine protein kinase